MFLIRCDFHTRSPRIAMMDPSTGEHRVRLVRFRTSVMNQLHALAMGQGLSRRKKLYTTGGRREFDRPRVNSKGAPEMPHNPTLFPMARNFMRHWCSMRPILLVILLSAAVTALCTSPLCTL
jgi:hypothetical protein